MRDFPRTTRITPIVVAAYLACGLAQSTLAQSSGTFRERPAKDVAGFIAHLRGSGGKVNVVSNGIGTESRLIAELFASAIGARLIYISTRERCRVLNDLTADQVDASFIQYSAFYDLHRAGRARILAVESEKRLEVAPWIPTMTEAGYPGLGSHPWYMLAAPPQTLPGVVQWLNKAVNEVLRSPDVNARFSAMHATVEACTLEDARRYLAADRARWRKVIQDAQIQPE